MFKFVVDIENLLPSSGKNVISFDNGSYRMSFIIPSGKLNNQDRLLMIKCPW